MLEVILSVIGSFLIIIIPELIYLTFMCVRFAGPAGLLVIPLYLILVCMFPVPVMAVCGVVIVVHLGFLIFREVAGNVLQKEKMNTSEGGTGGVPKLSDDPRTSGSTDAVKMADNTQATESPAKRVI